MTREEKEKRSELLKLAEEAIRSGNFNENMLKQAELYMQLAELYRV